MKDQLKTIREALSLATDGPIVDRDGTIAKALTALSELETSLAQYEAGDMASAAAQGFRDGVASVTQQEPVAWAWKHIKTGDVGCYFEDPATVGIKIDHPSYEWTKLYAAPVAQQPQARPDFTDEWTGYLKDGETPFERFLRERKDVQSALKLYQRALEENERLKAQQPQAEAVPLQVRYHSMPESCGRTNWTASLFVKGRGDFTIARSEYPHRVRYDADCVRWLIGELDEKPFILDYDGDEATPCHLCGGTGEVDGKPCHGLNFKGTVHHAPRQAEAVLPGYALVPVEPTAAMLQALSGEWHPSRHRPDLYRAMLAAAQGAKT